VIPTPGIQYLLFLLQQVQHMLYNLLYYSHGKNSVWGCHEVAERNEPGLFSPRPLVRFTSDHPWFYGGLTAGIPDSPSLRWYAERIPLCVTKDTKREY
jgi:hypothetical protein